MQNNIVMAFRKRLKKRGYENISIYKYPRGNIYDIRAIEPLGGTPVKVDRSLEWMYHSFR